jgi:poly-beta-hydroxyalkanoate depolymerase
VIPRAGVGHYEVFSGSRFQREIYLHVSTFGQS